jgi:flagellar motor switch protein FliM
MSSAAPHPMLRRMVAAAREDQSFRSMSLPKALRLTAPKVADSLFDLPLAVIGVTERRVTQSEAWALFYDKTLLILLNGPGGIVGAAALDGGLVGALIQRQTTGQVSASYMWPMSTSLPQEICRFLPIAPRRKPVITAERCCM